jgi:hypothetical protein
MDGGWFVPSKWASKFGLGRKEKKAINKKKQWGGRVGCFGLVSLNWPC